MANFGNMSRGGGVDWEGSYFMSGETDPKSKWSFKRCGDFVDLRNKNKSKSKRCKFARLHVRRTDGRTDDIIVE
jgi:hypothetical protein